MNQIISPWIFYLIDISENIEICLNFVLTALVFITVIRFIMNFDLKDDPICKKKNKRYIIAMCIVLATTAIIPSKETMYTMLVSNYVTYDNIEKASNVIKDSVDYIFDKLEDKQND